MYVWPREGRETGPGRVHQILFSTPKDADISRIEDNYWLYNFNFDGNVPKLEHEIVLRSIREVMRRRACHLEITGYADKTGNAWYNQQLSASRALMVKQWFRKRNVPESQLPGTRITAAGEIFSQDTSPDAISERRKDSWYRAVHLRLRTGVLSRPIPVVKPPEVDPTIYIHPGWSDIIIGRVFPHQKKPKPDGTPSAKWSWKHLEGISATAGASFHGIGVSTGVAGHRIIMFNHETGRHHLMLVTGSPGSYGPDPVSVKGMPVTPSMSYTPGSDQWKTVSFTRPYTYKDFEGDGEIEAVIFRDTTLRPQGLKGEEMKIPTSFPIGIPTLHDRGPVMIDVTPGFTGPRDRP